MEKEPLLPYSSPRKWPPILCPLPEDDEVALSVPLTPSEFKERLIFGPSPQGGDPLTLPSSPIPPPSLPGPSSTPKDSIFTPPHQEPTWLVDPNYASWSKKSNLHRSKTAPAMAVINDAMFHPPATNKPRVGSQTIVRQAIILLVLYLAFGVFIYWCNRDKFDATETHPVVDALYFCIVTMCTIGYGDITPNSAVTKLFSILFVLVGFGFIDILLSGMVSYMLDLQEGYLLRNLKRGGGRERESNTGSYIIDVKKGRMRIRMKVALALGVVVLCIGTGVGVLHFVEKLCWLDSFYLSVMSVTTVGYGDKAFTSLPGRLFASIWLLVSTLAVARAFLYLAEARVDKRNRTMAKWVLGQHMTVSEFLAADIDNNGFVRAGSVLASIGGLGDLEEQDMFLPVYEGSAVQPLFQIMVQALRPLPFRDKSDIKGIVNLQDIFNKLKIAEYTEEKLKAIFQFLLAFGDGIDLAAGQLLLKICAVLIFVASDYWRKFNLLSWKDDPPNVQLTVQERQELHVPCYVMVACLLELPFTILAGSSDAFPTQPSRVRTHQDFQLEDELSREGGSSVTFRI